MFAQLGTTIFDGLKSFVTFSSDEEAIVVEYALINRKPRLQGTGMGLRTISITLFLNQEYCKVTDEIAKLRRQKDTFEILPLLWGNGTLEGNFVITALSTNNTFMDNLGNLISANVAVILKEAVNDDALDKAQQDAINNAFAVGDKKPATKSTRVNPSPCNSTVASEVSKITSNAAQLDKYMRSYTVQSDNNQKAYLNLRYIHETALTLQTQTGRSDFPCVNGNTNISLYCSNLVRYSNQLEKAITYNYNNDPPNYADIKSNNSQIQINAALLKKACSGNLAGAIIRK